MRLKRLVFVGLLVFLRGGILLAAEGNTEHQIRSYMAFSYPVDPVQMPTIPDMDLSYALGATLVQWDADKQIAGGVAESWEVISETTYRFKIRSDLKWSDGNSVTSRDIQQSFERGFKRYPEDLRSLRNLIIKITCPDSEHVDFHLSVPARESGLLGKLTEPNYGILKVGSPNNKNDKNNVSIDLSVSTGAFYLAKNTKNELILERNSHWFAFSKEVPQEIVIRKPPEKMDVQRVLLEDPWPNLIETTSLVSTDTMSAYKKGGYKIWTRPLDKLLLLQVSRKLVENPEGLALVRFLSKNLDRSLIVSQQVGISLSSQVFPVGYQLHDPRFQLWQDSEKLPARFHKNPIHVLYSNARIPSGLRKGFQLALTKTLGVEPIFESIRLEEMGPRRKKGDYDFYLGTMGLADPDPEGIMSYYFEGDAPVVPSGNEPFVARLDSARKEADPKNRLQRMRELMTDATLKGHILPIFHLSTVGLGRPELDFSKVPISDESVTLSKIRFAK